MFQIHCILCDLEIISQDWLPVCYSFVRTPGVTPSWKLWLDMETKNMLLQLYWTLLRIFNGNWLYFCHLLYSIILY